jgi:hypothetical protein
MNETAKRAFWVGGWVLSILAAFGGGLWAALHLYGLLQSTPFLNRELVEAIQAQQVLEYLDSGAPNEAKANLYLRMDGHILVIGSLLDTTSSEKDRETARKFLHRVAKHRRKFPASYPESLKSPDLQKARAMVAEILTSAENEQKK